MLYVRQSLFGDVHLRAGVEKDEINVPIALSAFRDGNQGPSKVTISAIGFKTVRSERAFGILTNDAILLSCLRVIRMKQCFRQFY